MRHEMIARLAFARLVIVATGRVIGTFVEGHSVASINADQIADGATDAEFAAGFICHSVLAVKL